jgi:hypothetical protein
VGDRLQHPEFDSSIFRDVVGRFASGVTVITTRDGGQDFGMTASAMSSLSLDPPMILICVNRRAASRQAISHARVFGVNILHEDQASLAVHFATPQADKFKALSVSRGGVGCPRLYNPGSAPRDARHCQDTQDGQSQLQLVPPAQPNYGGREEQPSKLDQIEYVRHCTADSPMCLHQDRASESPAIDQGVIG